MQIYAPGLSSRQSLSCTFMVMKDTQKSVSKRLETIHVRLPETVAADLREVAEQERRPISNLAAFLIEQGLEQRKTGRKV
jgi:hypothetical protein